MFSADVGEAIAVDKKPPVEAVSGTHHQPEDLYFDKVIALLCACVCVCVSVSCCMNKAVAVLCSVCALLTRSVHSRHTGM